MNNKKIIVSKKGAPTKAICGDKNPLTGLRLRLRQGYALSDAMESVVIFFAFIFIASFHHQEAQDVYNIYAIP